MYQGQQKKNNGFDLNQLLIIVIVDISECLMFEYEAGVAPPALALICQYQASIVKNRISSIPRGAFF